MKKILTSMAVVALGTAIAFAEAGGERPNDGAYTSSTGATTNVQNNGESTDQSDPPGAEPATVGTHYNGQQAGHYYREVNGEGGFVCWRQYSEKEPTVYRWNRYNSPTGTNPPAATATPGSTGTMNPSP